MAVTPIIIPLLHKRYLKIAGYLDIFFASILHHLHVSFVCDSTNTEKGEKCQETGQKFLQKRKDVKMERLRIFQKSPEWSDTLLMFIPEMLL
jgi:hypothetical protein